MKSHARKNRVDLSDIRSLSDFQRNAKAHIRRLKKTGRPEVLTVNGEASLVVQDAGTYQKLLDELEQAQTREALRRSIAQADRGEGIPAEELFADLRRRLGIKDRT